MNSKTLFASNDDISSSIAHFQYSACSLATAAWNVSGIGIFLPSSRLSTDGLFGGARATKLAYSTAWTQGFFFCVNPFPSSRRAFTSLSAYGRRVVGGTIRSELLVPLLEDGGEGSL
jgi:hypothetical protein